MLSLRTLVESRVERLQPLLRETTKAAHHRIDHHSLLAPLIRPELRIEHYQNVLLALRAVYASLQPSLYAALMKYAPDIPFVIGNRLEWLANDFDALGLEDQSAEDVTKYSALRAPVIADANDLVGYLYVVEGSALGGLVIAEQIKKSLGLSRDNGIRFYSGYEASTMSHWRSFWAMAGYLCPEDAQDRVSSAANRLFIFFEDVLDMAQEKLNLPCASN